MGRSHVASLARCPWARCFQTSQKEALASRSTRGQSLQNRLQAASAVEELSSLELQRLLASCASVRTSPEEVQQALGAHLARALAEGVDLEALLSIARSVAFLHNGRSSQSLSHSVGILVQAAKAHKRPSEVRRLLQVLAKIPGKEPRRFLESAARGWAGDVLGAKEWSLTLNAFARAQLPQADAEALLEENLAMLGSDDFRMEEWSALNLSLLCNSLHRLAMACGGSAGESRPKELRQRWHEFLSRVASNALPKLRESCSPQDVAQFATAFAAVPTGPHRSALAQALEKLLQSQRRKSFVEALSLEGLCGILVAMQRLGCCDEAFLAAASQRLRRSRAQLTPNHLGQVCNAFARWLEADSDAKDHRTADAGKLGESVQELFRTTFCPAIAASAAKFRNPRHLGFVAFALMRLGHAGHRTLESLAAAVLAALEEDFNGPLHLSKWPVISLVQLTEALSDAVLRHQSEESMELIAVEALQHAVADHLRSDGSNLEPAEAVRFAAALHSVPGCLDFVRRTAEALGQSARELSLRDGLLMLGTLQQLELREAALWQPLLWHLHRAVDKETWSPAVAITLFRTLERLDCYCQLLAEEVDPVQAFCAKIAELLQGMQLTSELDVQNALSLARSLQAAAEGAPMSQQWRQAVLAHVASVACRLDINAWSTGTTEGQRSWLHHAFLLGRVVWATGHPGARRSLLSTKEPDFQLSPGAALRLLRSFAVANFDLSSSSALAGALATVGTMDDLKGWQKALLLPSLAASSSCRTPPMKDLLSRCLCWELEALHQDENVVPEAAEMSLAGLLLLSKAEDETDSRTASQRLLLISLARAAEEATDWPALTMVAMGLCHQLPRNGLEALPLQTLRRFRSSADRFVQFEVQTFSFAKRHCRMKPAKQGQDADSGVPASVKRLIRICLNLGVRVNKAFLLLTKCLQILLLPQLSSYQYRVYFVYVLQVLGSEVFQLLIAKCLQSYYYVNNLLLLLSLGSFLPFLRVVYKLWIYIPCPPMASLISNVALVLTLVMLLILGSGTSTEANSSANVFQVYIYAMMIWPWLVLTSVVSRLFIERQAGRNPFSPVKEEGDLPILGFCGGLSGVMSFVALKNLTICDCLVLSIVDNMIAAAVASMLMGKYRRRRHFRAIKVYAFMCGMILLYFLGDTGLSNMSRNFPLNEAHVLFVVSRFFLVTRSIYVKWKYATFHHTKEPSMPPENLLLFYANARPTLHRFRNFPSPMLLVLDCVFDSGLRDTELHGMGPLGTEDARGPFDLYNLTEFTYLLPVASLASWLIEESTLSQGLFPQTGTGVGTALGMSLEAAAASAAEGAATVQVSGDPQEVVESAGGLDLTVTLILVAIFCLSKLVTPVAMARALYDRASPIQGWKYQPMLVAAPCLLRLQVVLLSGRSVEVAVDTAAKVWRLEQEVKDAIGFWPILSAGGRILKETGSLMQEGLEEGAVVQAVCARSFRRLCSSQTGHGFVAVMPDGTCLQLGRGRWRWEAMPELVKQQPVQWVEVARFGFAALLRDGSVVTWFTSENGEMPREHPVLDVARLVANSEAFAAVHTDGTVTTWGGMTAGGDSSAVQLVGVTQVEASGRAFAALRHDGSVVAWGAPSFGGSTWAVRRWLVRVKQLKGSRSAFAALRSDGQVVTWGNRAQGGDSHGVQRQLRGVSCLFACDGAFAALCWDGSVITWGEEAWGGNSSQVSEQLQGVREIVSTAGAFAAILADGSVVTWGHPGYGGESGRVQSQLQAVRTVAATRKAFAALRSDGVVITWGDALCGGYSHDLEEELASVEDLWADSAAFCARRSDASLVAWGLLEDGINNSQQAQAFIYRMTVAGPES
eukprot:s473_g21.t3